MLTINLDLQAFVSYPGRQPLAKLCLPRRPLSVLPVQFIRGGVVQAVGTGAETGIFGAKPPGQFGAGYTFEATAWGIVAGPPPVYAFPFLTDTAALRTALGVGTACPLEAVTLKGQLRWTDGAGNTFNTVPIPIEVANEYVDDDTDPITNAVNWAAITGLAGGLATDLDAAPTANLIRFGTFIVMAGVTDPVSGLLLNAGGATIWQFQQRTDATAFGLQRPLDFNAVTNPGVWTKVL
jgi:hypothetical protein